MEKTLIGALEAGGTKMVCAVGYGDGTVLEQVSMPTTTPEETMEQVEKLSLEVKRIVYDYAKGVGERP